MINIAIMGYGVVGSGVAEVLTVNREIIRRRAGDYINIKYILDIREFPGDIHEDKLINDFNIILNDPEIKIVAELMGGVRAALEFTEKALRAKKNVVTSNKELVAYHGDRLLKIACDNGVRYMFEASVGGGIPIIAPLEESLAANDIYEINAIINGTTNYILTAMRNGKLLSDALAEARKNGYAESDPTDDIEGHDSCRKICILAAIAFGVLFEPETVSVKGISSITAEDMAEAERNDRIIKLIARAVRLENDKINICVAPFAINKSNPLAHIDGVYNAVLMKGNAVGDVMFYGKGAGSLPTASSVAADIIHIATCKQKQSCRYIWKRNPDLYVDKLNETQYLHMRETLGEPLGNA
ncbi:MAG: homoserine dehydrogenase [Eubacteriales bacterium]|nr:homoserine dehydrogenase [Eubacteriales bacterium]